MNGTLNVPDMVRNTELRRTSLVSLCGPMTGSPDKIKSGKKGDLSCGDT
jgi:hypothetical protein